MRNSLSKLKKDFKHHLGGKKRASDKAGANVTEETASSSVSLTRPGSRVTMGVRDEEGSRIGTGVSGVHPRDLSPQPKLVQTDEGRDKTQGRKVDVEEKEVRQRYSREDPNVEAAVGSGPSQENNRVSSTLSVTPIAPEQGPHSTQTLSLQQLCLSHPFR